MDFFGRVSVAEGLSASPPAHTHAGVSVLFEGYLLDRAELAAKLGATPADSDAALIARAYRRWGTALADHVLGAYAIACFDAANMTALLTHDALGVGAVFYGEGRGGLGFASNLLDLLTPENTGELDPAYFSQYMMDGYICSERTPFVSLKRLLPGESLMWSGKGQQLVSGWSVADCPDVRYPDPASYQERFNELIAAATRSTEPASGNSWVALSGGLDSASVACVAARQGTVGLGAYSLVYPGHEASDERPWMEATVDHCAIPWHTVDAETVLPFTQLPLEFVAEPTPMEFHGALHHARTQTLGAANVSCLLTGDGGDAILAASPGISPTHLADGLFTGRPWQVPAAMNAWRARSNERRPLAYWARHTVVRPAWQHLRGRTISPQPAWPLPPWLAPDYAKAMHSVANDHHIARHCRTPSRQSLADNLWRVSLSLGRGQLRRPGYETRYPPLYRPLVEFMCGVPWEEKLHPRCDRYLQRRALKSILPEFVRRRAYKAVGTWSFVEGLRRSPMWFARLCDSPAIVDQGMATAADWQMAVRQAALGQTHGDRFFLTAAAIESWLKGLKAWRSATPDGTSTREAEITTAT